MNKLLLPLGFAALSLALLASQAFAYQFIISGNPVAAATEGSCSVASAGIALGTGTISAAAVPDAPHQRGVRRHRAPH